MLRVRLARSGGKPKDVHFRWRIRVLGKQVLYYTALAEVIMRDKTGGPQLAAGGVATASSNAFGDPTLPPKAFDGNPATYWADDGNAAPQWLAYQFPTKVEIVELAITYGPAGNTGIPTSFEVQALDEVTAQWVTKWSVPAVGAWAYGTTRTFAR